MDEPLKLPELPEPTLETNGDVFGHENVEGYTAEQMRDYGRRCREAGIRAEKTCAASLVDAVASALFSRPSEARLLRRVAEGIRKGEQK